MQLNLLIESKFSKQLLFRGQVPSAAELNYLDKVKWLEMYGVDLHPVLVCGKHCYKNLFFITPGVKLEQVENSVSFSGRGQRRVLFGSDSKWYNFITQQNQSGKLLLAPHQQNIL